MMILVIILFSVLQIFIAKKGLPPQLAAVKLRYLLLGSILLIAGCMLLGILLNIAVPLTAVATVTTSVVISYRFRISYAEIEKGKII